MVWFVGWPVDFLDGLLVCWSVGQLVSPLSRSVGCFGRCGRSVGR